MNKGIIAPVEPLSADGLAVEQQLMARVLSSPLYSSSHLSSDNPASAGTSMNSGSHTQVHPANGPGKKGSAAQRAARLKAEPTRVAQAALRAFIASVPVPRFDTAVLMDLEDMEDFDRHHDNMRDANDVCLEADGDGSDAVSMESSALETPSESYSQSNSNSSTQQSQELVSGVKEVRISSGITGPRSNDGGDASGEGEEEEEEEDDEGEEDLGLTPEQYLYVVAALCQVGWSGLSFFAYSYTLFDS